MDGVVADSEVSCCVVVGDGFCSGCVGLGGGFPVQCAVGSAGVVVVGEFVELVLEFGQVACSWSCGEPAFECLVEAFDFSLCLGVVGCSVLLVNAEVEEFYFEGVGSATMSGGEDESVVGQRGLGCAVGGAGGTEGGQHDCAGDGFVGGGGDEESGVGVEPEENFRVVSVG